MTGFIRDKVAQETLKWYVSTEIFHTDGDGVADVRNSVAVELAANEKFVGLISGQNFDKLKLHPAWRDETFVVYDGRELFA